jgi:hypothetical protein
VEFAQGIHVGGLFVSVRCEERTWRWASPAAAALDDDAAVSKRVGRLADLLQNWPKLADIRSADEA